MVFTLFEHFRIVFLDVGSRSERCEELDLIILLDNIFALEMSILKDKIPRFGGAVHFHQSCPIFTVVKRMLSSEEQIQLLNDLFMIC